MLDLQPLGTRIIVKQIIVDKVGSIIIPETSREAKELMATEGEVLVKGGDVTNVKVGDNVFYGKYAGTTIKRDGQEYRIMDVGDVLCLINIGEE